MTILYNYRIIEKNNKFQIQEYKYIEVKWWQPIKKEWVNVFEEFNELKEAEQMLLNKLKNSKIKIHNIIVD